MSHGRRERKSSVVDIRGRVREGHGEHVVDAQHEVGGVCGIRSILLSH